MYILNYSSVGEGSVATLVCCELLADVHRLCETSTSSSPDATYGGELRGLRTYLAHERGWRSLAVLQLLGVRELSCGRELVALLLALYPLLATPANSTEKKGYNPYLKFYPNDEQLDALDLTLQKRRRKKRRRNVGEYGVMSPDDDDY